MKKKYGARSEGEKFCSLIFMSMQFSPFYLRSDSTSIITTMFQMYNAKEKEREKEYN